MLDNSPACGELSLTLKECEEEALKLGYWFRSMNGSHAPHACHLDYKGGKFRTWWNANAGAFGKEKYKTICKIASKGT